jgi:hypothetical protein
MSLKKDIQMLRALPKNVLYLYLMRLEVGGWLGKNSKKEIFNKLKISPALATTFLFYSACNML